MRAANEKESDSYDKTAFLPIKTLRCAATLNARAHRTDWNRKQLLAGCCERSTFTRGETLGGNVHFGTMVGEERVGYKMYFRFEKMCKMFNYLQK